MPAAPVKAPSPHSGRLPSRHGGPGNRWPMDEGMVASSSTAVENPNPRVITPGGQRLAESLVSEVSGLVSPPDVCLRVAELVQDEETTADQLGELILRDPNLTARLLRLVNSAHYGLRGRVDTVSRAITMIGLRELYHLVLAVSAVKSFSSIPNSLVNMDTFWRHSIFTGLIARGLARQAGVLHPERLFITGLLHDIGSLVLYFRLRELSCDLLTQADGDEDLLHRLEFEALGFTHADLGALMLKQWSLPEPMQDAVRMHHDPLCLDTPNVDAALLALANTLANRSQIGAFCETPREAAPPSAELITAAWLDAADFDEEVIIGEAGLSFTETVSVLAA
jgi:HD-like signal output (HDOD) protein